MSLPDIQDAIDLLEQGKPAEAVPLLEAVAAHMPTYVAVHAMAARAYEASQQPAEALAAWERAAFLMPNSPAIREGLARTRAASPATPSAEEERLRVDLDLQAELDAALETPFNPFARPLHSDTPPEALDLDEERPMTLAEASLALIERALSEAEIEAEEKTTAPPEPPAEKPEASDQILAARRALEAEAAAEQESNPLSADTEEDLDRLIDELGTARIVPQPDVDHLPPPDLDDDIDDMVSETLARIYASQEQFGEAARVYEQLARQQPDQAERFLAEAAAMRSRE